MKRELVSVVIAMYNEADNITILIEKDLVCTGRPNDPENSLAFPQANSKVTTV